METIKFNKLEEQQLMELNGGGFAYDVGRILRFIGVYVAYGSIPAVGTTIAIADWETNTAINEAANAE